jgi:hypothetical protein
LVGLLPAAGVTGVIFAMIDAPAWDT